MRTPESRILTIFDLATQNFVWDHVCPEARSSWSASFNSRARIICTAAQRVKADGMAWKYRAWMLVVSSLHFFSRMSLCSLGTKVDNSTKDEIRRIRHIDCLNRYWAFPSGDPLSKLHIYKTTSESSGPGLRFMYYSSTSLIDSASARSAAMRWAASATDFKLKPTWSLKLEVVT